MSMVAICLRCFVSGQVQGVFYRRAAREQALRYGISGFAKNLPDGRVETILCGEQKNVEAMRDWLWQGPVAAKVLDVEVCVEPLQSYEGFEIR
jgi:acylphosphatase